jgi:hypothetical protein
VQQVYRPNREPQYNPVLVDMIGRSEIGAETLAVSRIFVFDARDDLPGFVMVYIARNGKPYLHTAQPIESFSRSPKPRSTPHEITLQSGETITCQLAGCGCGNPIKRMSWSQAQSDWDKMVAGGLLDSPSKVSDGEPATIPSDSSDSSAVA